MTRFRMWRCSDDGFTLMELVIAAALLLIATLAMGQALDSSLSVSRTTDAFTTAQRDGRRVLDELVRETRARGTIVTPPTTTDDPGPMKITFTTVNDTAAGIPLRTIHYEMTGGALRKRINNGNLVAVLPGLLNDLDPTTPAPPVFTYFDAQGSQITTGIPAAARRVRIDLVIAVERREPLVLTTEITFRST